MLTTDINTNNDVVGIYPNLRTAVSNTTFKHKDDVIMPCLYDLDTILGMSYTDGILMDLGTIKLIEKLA